MAITTASAFDEFKNKLLLTEVQTEMVKSRQKTTASYLLNSFPASSSLPLRTTTIIGSAGRNTIIRPLDDIDVIAIFNNKGNIFENFYRNDSQKFLYRVRDALNAYRVELVGARGQAVRLFYATAPHVDIAPVFEWSGGGYALPNGTGGWLTTNPDVQDDWIAKRHSELGNRLKPMIRMIKRWNNVHSKHLKGFHIEVMLASTFTSLNSDSRDACAKFFLWGQNWLGVADPAGQDSDLSTYLSSSARASVLSNMKSAHERATAANFAEAAGDHREAIRLWRVIFGDEFPAYG